MSPTSLDFPKTLFHTQFCARICAGAQKSEKPAQKPCKCMKQTTFNISFYCRNCRVNRDGTAPVEMSIVIAGRRCLLSLPRKEKPTDFMRQVNAKKDNDLKIYLDAIRHKVREIETEMLLRDIPLTASLLRDYFRSGGVQNYSVKDLFDDYFVILRKRIGVNLSVKTFRKYELARDRLYALVDKQKPVDVLNNALMKNYLAALHRDYDYCTAQGYGQKIKTVCLFAIANGKMKTDPFFDISLRKGEKSVQFLEEEDMQKIKCAKIENPSINKIRDLFLFQINSGISYCDMAALLPEDFQTTEEGQYYVHKQRAKTKNYYTAVIFADGVEVLKRYHFRLPILSNQKYNLYLKTLRDICGIDKPLHTHVARHTYATMCLNKGIRLEVVAKLLGHSDSRMTTHYAKLIKKTIISEVQEAFFLQTKTKQG